MEQSDLNNDVPPMNRNGEIARTAYGRSLKK